MPSLVVIVAIVPSPLLGGLIASRADRDTPARPAAGLALLTEIELKLTKSGERGRDGKDMGKSARCTSGIARSQWYTGFPDHRQDLSGYTRVSRRRACRLRAQLGAEIQTGLPRQSEQRRRQSTILPAMGNVDKSLSLQRKFRNISRRTVMPPSLTLQKEVEKSSASRCQNSDIAPIERKY